MTIRTTQYPDIPAHTPATGTTLLDVENLTVDIVSGGGHRRVVDQVNLALRERETLALIGESGSGKSMTAMAVMGLLEPDIAQVGGSVRHQGTDLLRLPPEQLRARRGKHVAMIFQDSLSALNPTLTVGYQIAETIRAHESVTRKQARARAVELMARVRIPAPKRRYHDYPHQFSGGMRQRIMIAMAVALSPDVLIADEPTTALDVTVQAQIMELLAELRAETGSALLLITHDLGVAASAADRVAIMYAGRIVETAPVLALYEQPAHHYTRGLLDAVPRLNAALNGLAPIPGTPPHPGSPPGGCAFHPRCPAAQPYCGQEAPKLLPGAPGRLTACHYPLTSMEAARG